MMLTTFRKATSESEAHILVLVDTERTRVPYDDKLGYFENHVAAARKVARGMGWQILSYGDHPKGYTFVNSKMQVSV